MNAMRIFIWSLFYFTSLNLIGCSVTPEDYRDEKPVLDMSSYFDGQLEAWGIFQNYTGKVVKRFKVDMTGTWQGNEGILDELFTYSDGSTQRRTWKLRKIDENRYSGSAGDVVGIAAGVSHGNALRWVYTMALEVDEEIYHVKFDDWMYMVDEDTVINRSIMKKFGINIGEVTLIFRRVKADSLESAQRQKPLNMNRL